MNEKKIAFIMAVNNELYYEESKWYIDQLIIPAEYEIDIITIREANSMAEAYNAAMESSDAKYKVYMHQDVYIINKNFISDLIEVFHSDKKIGLLGVIGGVKLPESGVMFDAWNCGRTITCDYSLSVDIEFYQKKPYNLVDALDGMFLATQYDIPWREDILKKWHYYDISQSFEFKKAGYSIAIPYQSTPWMIHDSGFNDLSDYDTNRKIMFDEYSDFLKEKWEEHPFKYNYELQSLTQYIYNQVELLINHRQYKEAEIILNEVKESGMSKNMPILKQLFRISNMERNCLKGCTLLDKGLLTSEYITRYTMIKFYLRRLEYTDKFNIKEILEWIHKYEVSSIEIMIIIIHNLLDRKKVFGIISIVYKEANDLVNERIMETIPEELEVRNICASNRDKEYKANRRSIGEYWSNNK